MTRVGWRTVRNALLLCCLLTLTGANDPPAQPGNVLDEARQAVRSAASLPAATEDYFHDMDGGIALAKDSTTGLDPVVGRNMWLVWTRRQRRVLGQDDALHIRCVRSAEDRRLRPEQADRPRQALELPRFDQRAVLRRADRSGSESFRPAARCAQSELSRRSVRGRGEVSRRPHRRARQDRAGRFAVRLRQRHRRVAAVPQSRLRRGGKGEVGCGRVFQGRSEPGASVPRRHVLRLLPCRPEPGASAGRSGQSAMGRSQFHRRRAVHVGGSPVRLSRQSRQLHLPACAHLPAGRDGHVAGLDRQHQQSAHDERGLQPGRRGSIRRCAGAARRSPAAQLNNKQFNDYLAQRPADALLPEAEHRPGRRAC